MGKKARKKNEARASDSQIEDELFRPWIKMRTAIILMTIVSIALGIWTAYQVSATETLLNSIMWGTIFGGSTWIVFLGFMLFNRTIRRKR